MSNRQIGKLLKSKKLVGLEVGEHAQSRVIALLRNRDLSVDGILEWLACDIQIGASEEYRGSAILIRLGIEVDPRTRSFFDKVTQKQFPRRSISVARVSKGSHANDFLSIVKEVINDDRWTPEVVDVLSRKPWSHCLSLSQAMQVIDLVFESAEKSKMREDETFGGKINFKVYHPVLILVKADCHVGNNGDKPVSRSFILEFRLTDKKSGTFAFHLLDSPIEWGPGATIVMANV